MTQRLDIGVAGQHRLERIQQRNQGINALELHPVGTPGEQAVARRLQLVGEGCMGVYHRAQGGRARGVGIVERRLGPQVIGEGAHRFGQQQAAHPVVEQPGHSHGIESVDQPPQHRHHQMLGCRGGAGEMLTHGQHEGQHAGHGQAQHPFAIGRDQSGPKPDKGHGCDEGGGVELREPRQGREEPGAGKGRSHDPLFLPQGIGAVGDGDAQRCAAGRHRGRKAQRKPHQQPGQAHAHGHRQPVFDMGAEHRQGNVAGYGTGEGRHLVLLIGRFISKASQPGRVS